MKTLTIKSPWAQYIFRSGKDIENRSWKTNYRGPMLIHTSNNPKSSESGMIMGIVELFDCQPPGNLLTSGNKWAINGFYHWIFKNPREFKIKIPVKGKLNLWDYDFSPSFLKELL